MKCIAAIFFMIITDPVQMLGIKRHYYSNIRRSRFVNPVSIPAGAGKP